ncbi:MAG: molybdopterin oxidoreductase family protein, partial [Ilumatobacteraceae bacterium]
ALAALLAAVPTAKVLPVLRRGNVNGALAVGLAPAGDALDTHGMLAAAADGRLECLVLLGADPLSDFPDATLALAALDRVPRLIAVDTMLTRSSERAHVVLAAAAYAEKSGTHTNIEGRVTRLAQKVTPVGTARPDWMIAAGLADALGAEFGVDTVDDLTAEIAANVPGFAGVTAATLSAVPDGVVAELGSTRGLTAPVESVAPRRAGAWRLVLGRTLYDLATGTAASRSLSGLAAPTAAHLHPDDVAALGGAEQVRLTNGRASTVLPVAISDTVLPGTVWVPFNHAGGDITLLVDSAASVTDVEIEAV